tara:strand:+ start:350 stop:724 length:375 start_codon:yes stop_codon:yes gene_type:complete
MSSAVAMNRRIAKERGDSSTVQEFVPAPSGRQRATTVKGTPVQQCWRVLNFHETRLNRIEEQTHVLTRNARMMQAGEGVDSSQLSVLMQRMDRLEQENIAFRKHFQQMNQKASKKSMSLEVSEN